MPCQPLGPASQACAALIADDTVVRAQTSVQGRRALWPRWVRTNAAMTYPSMATSSETGTS